MGKGLPRSSPSLGKLRHPLPYGRGKTASPCAALYHDPVTPLVREIPIPDIRAALAAHEGEGALWLDSALFHQVYGRFSYLALDPYLTLRLRGDRIHARGAEHWDAEGNPFPHLARLLEEHRVSAPPGLPTFIGGAAGYLGYDLGRHIERVPTHAADDLGLPDAWLGFYDVVCAVDHAGQRAWIIATGLPETRAGWRQRRAQARSAQMEGWLARAAARGERQPVGSGGCDGGVGEEFELQRPFFTDAVRRAQEYIAAGDIYQVNLAFREELPAPRDPLRAYERLRAVSPGSYAAYLDIGEAQILSSSPECFLRVRGSQVETRPIKGTRPRGATPAEDARLAAELAASQKDRAENVMIVDLERNDLGRVCSYGTVRVSELWSVETYATLHHLTSAVTGDLYPGRGRTDLLKAAFPGGSITGAPKVRAMEIIEELEPVRRGVYTGAIGCFSATGDADLNIAIRTATVTGGRAYFHVGCGIVADSDPDAEFEEAVVKAQGLARALSPARARV